MNWIMRNQNSARMNYVPEQLGLPLGKVWESTLSSTSLAPAVTNEDNVFISTVDVVWAIKKSSGGTLWRFDCPGGEGERLNGFKASPIVANGYLFIADMQGNVNKLNAEDGEVIERALGIGAHDEPFCLYDGHLFSRFVNADADQKGYGYARMSMDLELIWAFYGDGSYSTTSCAIESGRLVYGDRTGFLYCLDADSGNEIWRVDVEPNVSPPTSPYARRDPIPVGMPMIIKDLIVVRCGGDVVGFDLGSGEPRWNIHPAEGLDKPAPADCMATDEEYLYFTVNGTFRKVALATGEFILTIHHESLGLSRSMDGIVVGDHYLAGFNMSHILAIINTRTGEIDSKISSDAGFRSAPIWDDGSLYVYDDLARLYKFSRAS